jgi:hypothetical protein
MSFPAVVEIWTSEALLFLPDLPGFQVKAITGTDALDLARERVRPFLHWLEEGELIPELPVDSTIELVETTPATGAIGPFFAADAQQSDAEQIEFGLSVGRAALSDLLFVFDDVDRERRSEAERVLRHVAELDRWYATRLSPAQGAPFAAIEDELVQSASLFEEVIDTLVSAGRHADWVTDNERWSVAKALRRRTGHLREHLPDLIALTH